MYMYPVFIDHQQESMHLELSATDRVEESESIDRQINTDTTLMLVNSYLQQFFFEYPISDDIMCLCRTVPCCAFVLHELDTEIEKERIEQKERDGERLA